jgi:type IV secretion system protein VirB9
VRSAAVATVVAVLALQPAAAAVTPQPGPGDPRIQSVEYSAQQVVLLRVSLNYALTIEFSPDERVENVSVGNSGAWQVAVNRSANRLFVKPAEMSQDTDMTVVTDTRIYTFQLEATPSPDPSMAFVLSFTYPRAPQDQPSAASSAVTSIYRFGGARELTPLSMTDDGHATTISWPEKTPFPQISIIDEDGKESLANGAVRGGRYVIDQVADRYVFRVGGRVATATRHVVKAPRR